MYQLNETKTAITIHDTPDLAWVQCAARKDGQYPIMNCWHIMPDYIEAIDGVRIHRLYIPSTEREPLILKVNPNRKGLPAPLKNKPAIYPCEVWTDTAPFPDTEYLISPLQYKHSITVNRAQLAWVLSMDDKQRYSQHVTTLEADGERLWITYNDITIDIAAPGAVKDGIVIGINRWLLMDTLSMPLPESQREVLIHFTGEYTPVVIESPCQTWRAWIMPMRLGAR